jgi:hypothetical protein
MLAERTQIQASSTIPVPDYESRDREVVLVRRTTYFGETPLGVGNLEWGGTGEGLRKGRSAVLPTGRHNSKGAGKKICAAEQISSRIFVKYLPKA